MSYRCPFCTSELTDESLRLGHCPACGELLPESLEFSGDSDSDSGTLGKGRQDSQEDVVLDSSSDTVDAVQDIEKTIEQTPDTHSQQDDASRGTVGIDQTVDLGAGSADDTIERTMDVSPEQMQHMTSMWENVTSDTDSPDQTIKVDATVTGSRSSLVIKSRSLLKASGTQPATEGADYELLDVIGKGGMGVVYAARQASVDRKVAIKMLKPGSETSIDQREKFISEAVVTGDLDHPNIVPIYDLGTNDSGALFYSMKCVQGTPWNEVIKQKRLPENIEILMKVADAVAFAHHNGIIHRDLKPENVMLGDYGEVLVMDWGLALATSDFRHHESITQTASMGGTPAYMPPEMALGPIEKVGASSDIYLLGAILYEIVTGKLPHTGKDVMACLKAAARNEIQPTDKSGEIVDIAMRAMADRPEDRFGSVQDFQAAVREYQSHSESIALSDRATAELAKARSTDDYQDYSLALFGFQEAHALWSANETAITGVATTQQAYAESAYRKGDYELGLSLLDKFNPQHSALIDQLLESQRERDSRAARLRNLRRSAVGLVATVIIVITVAFFKIRAERDRAEIARAAAVEARELEEQQRLRAENEKERADTERMKAVAAKEQEAAAKDQAILAKNQAVEARNQAEAAKVQAEQAREVAVQAKLAEEYESYIAQIGLAAAKIDENAFDAATTLLEESTTRLRNWEWGRLRYLCRQDVGTYQTPAPIDTVAWHPSGKYFATGGRDGKLRLWEVGLQQPTYQHEHGQYVTSVAFSSNAAMLASGSSDGTIRVYRAPDGKLVQSLSGHQEGVLNVEFSADGQFLLSTSYDKSIRLWSVRTGELLQTMRGHHWWVWSAAFSPDEKKIVSTGQDGRVLIWSIDLEQPRQTAKEVGRFDGHEGPVYSAAFSPDNQWVASAGYDSRVLLWDSSTLETINLQDVVEGKSLPEPELYALAGHSAPVRCLDFASDRKRLVSCGHDNRTIVWDLATKKPMQILRGHGGRVRACAFSADTKFVLSGSHDHSAKIWDLGRYEEVRVLKGRVLGGHVDALLSASFSTDGKKILTASRDRTAKIWDIRTGKEILTLDEGHEFLATTALFSADAQSLYTAAGDNTVRLWEVSTGTQLHVLKGAGRRGALARSQDNLLIATGSDDKTVKLWDTESAKLRQSLSGHKAEVTVVTFSPDNQYLVSCDALGGTIVWRQDNEHRWAIARRLKGHSRSVTAAALLPDGRTLLTASGDRTVAQWNIETGEALEGSSLLHPEWISSMSISPDGTKAVTTCEDKKVRIWDIRTAKVVRTLPTGDAPITTTSISHDGKQIVTASPQTRRVRLFDLATGEEIFASDVPDGNRAYLDLNLLGGLLWSVTFTPDDRGIVTVGGNDSRLWNIDTREEQMTFTPHGAIASANFSPDNRFVVTGSWDNSAKIWDASTGKSLRKLIGEHTGYVNTACFSPNGRLVLTASDDGTAVLWNARTGTATKIKYMGHQGRVRSAVFSPDGFRILTASEDRTARIWDARTGKQQQVLQGHQWSVLDAVFSQDGKFVATGSEDNTAKVWDAETGKLLMTFAGHTAGISGVAFSADGSRLFTSSYDQLAKVWDTKTGKEILTLSGHEKEVSSIKFSPAGESVLTSSRDGTAILWLAEPWK